MVLGISNKKPAEAEALATTPSHIRARTDSDVAIQKEGAHDKQALHKAEIPYKGDPENQTIVIDADETILFGDVYKRDLRKPKVRKQVEAEGYTIKQTKAGRYYVLRPGAEELLKDLYEKGHKMILCSRDLTPYLHDIYQSEPVLQKYIAGCLSRDDLISKPNADFKKYPNHPDNLGFWGRTKNFLHGVFVRCPIYCFKKFCSIFSGKPVWMEEGRGVAGKYPPNAVDLLVQAGNDKAKGLPASHILIDNYAEVDAEGKYSGRELQDSVASGDFAVISPNVAYKEGDKPKCFMADAPEPKDADGNYQWVENIKAAVDRGWKEQFKLTTGKEVNG